MNTFAYSVHAELNNDGSYKVTLLDIGCDEAPIYTVIDRAKLTIQDLKTDDNTVGRPLLTIE